MSNDVENIDPEIFLQRFAEVVRALREQLSISQEELGARAGLHRTYISDVECGARNLSLRTLCRLSSALRNYPSKLMTMTESKLIPERAKSEADLLLDLHHNAPSGFHSYDSEGLLLHMNDTLLNWLGYAREEVTGRMNVREIVFASDRDLFEEHFTKLKKTGASGPIKLSLARKGGDPMEILLAETAVRDFAGQYLRSRGSAIDLSKAKRSDLA